MRRGGGAATAVKKRGAQPRPNAQLPPKIPTDIEGFDTLSRGGLPRGGTTLLIGGPGAGKTVFALQCLVNNVRRQAPGIFVSFEESPHQIVANSSGWDWRLASVAATELFFLDARLSPTLVKAGDFDLAGMLAMLAAKKKAIGARWIVFDGIDVLLMLLENPAAELREIYRLREWLAESALTAIVTAKADERSSDHIHYGFMQFMVDCVVRFERHQDDRTSTQTIQIMKYRGSGYASAQFPISFGRSGIEVGAAELTEKRHAASNERITAGFKRLDAMLGGGIFRATSTLVTGAPGTAKTTLAGKFAEAACLRGERTLIVSYDESGDQIARNLASVGIQLRPHLKSGLLRVYAGRTEGVSPEEHFLKIRALIAEHQPRCMVIDPITAIAKADGADSTRTVAARLIDMLKDESITLLLTALSESHQAVTEATDLEISTIADTWIHLSYLVRSGERNRALTIVKSRGTAHSNQVRELVLTKAGPTLTDVYSAGGEVLMGTLRWEKEFEDDLNKTRRRAQVEQKRRDLRLVEAKTSAEIKALQLDLHRQRAELVMYANADAGHGVTSSEREREMNRRRGADPDDVSPKRAKRPKRAAG